MTAALRCWNRVTIGINEATLIFGPMDCPLDFTDTVFRRYASGKGRWCNRGPRTNSLTEIIG